LAYNCKKSALGLLLARIMTGGVSNFTGPENVEKMTLFFDLALLFE
jgi:hypothetical protein